MIRPLLSIYSPIFNHGKIIEENLAEIAKQVRDIGASDLIEIVLSDNCSTDDTAEKIQNFIKENSDLRIVYSCNAINVGGLQNIMDFGKKSLGKYVVMIGDDHFAKNGLRNIFEMILDGNDADFFMIKNNSYTDFEYLPNATTDDVFRNIEKIGFIGNSVLKKDFFYNDFKNYEIALKNFYPHVIMIMEKISTAKKVIDTRFVAINIGDSWNYKLQTKKLFQLLIDNYEIAYLVRSFIGEKNYKIYLKKSDKWLYDSLRFMRWHKNRLSLAIDVYKKLRVKNPKIILGLFIHSLPSPLFYLFRIISTSLKSCKQCVKEMTENRKMWKNKELLKMQNYTGIFSSFGN